MLVCVNCQVGVGIYSKKSGAVTWKGEPVKQKKKH